jgi:peptidylamidoglycolate lyase
MEMKARTAGGVVFSVVLAAVLGSCAADAAPGDAAEVTYAGPAHLSPLASAPPSYRKAADWPRLPAGMSFGDMSGVDIDGNGHVMVIHRGSMEEVPEGGRIPEPVVVTLHAETGEVLQTWGSNTFLNPHGLTVDHEENVWITDTGLHQVFKFTRDGKLLLTLGEAAVSGWDAGHFNRPTQVAVLPDGSFYVGDGYGNSRVAKFDKDGKFLFEWGEPGTGPGQFDNPHGVIVDPDGNILVSDRENSRVQIFDQSGKFIREWLGAKPTGRVFSAAVGPDEFIYLAIRPGGRDPLMTGVLKLDPDLNIVAQLGFKNTGDAVFQAAHFAAVGSDGAVYLAETPDRRVSKYVPVR